MIWYNSAVNSALEEIPWRFESPTLKCRFSRYARKFAIFKEGNVTPTSERDKTRAGARSKKISTRLIPGTPCPSFLNPITTCRILMSTRRQMDLLAVFGATHPRAIQFRTAIIGVWYGRTGSVTPSTCWKPFPINFGPVLSKYVGRVQKCRNRSRLGQIFELVSVREASVVCLPTFLYVPRLGF